MFKRPLTLALVALSVPLFGGIAYAATQSVSSEPSPKVVIPSRPDRPMTTAASNRPVRAMTRRPMMSTTTRVVCDPAGHERRPGDARCRRRPRRRHLDRRLTTRRRTMSATTTVVRRPPTTNGRRPRRQQLPRQHDQRRRPRRPTTWPTTTAGTAARGAARPTTRRPTTSATTTAETAIRRRQAAHRLTHGSRRSRRRREAKRAALPGRSLLACGLLRLRRREVLFRPERRLRAIA